jgi:hypothetical protein
VLVYDAKFDNGDVETRGYDIDSGEIVPLSATPGASPIPTSIPDPDSTGEERALVTSVMSIKTKTNEEDEGDGDDLFTATSSNDTNDIVVVPYVEGTEAVEATSTPEGVEDLDLATSSDDTVGEPAETEFEIEIPAYSEDLEMGTSTDGDSQESVATST